MIDLSLLIPPPSPADRAKWQMLIDAQNLYVETLEKGRPDLHTQKLLDMNAQLSEALEHCLLSWGYAERATNNMMRVLQLDKHANPWAPK